MPLHEACGVVGIARTTSVLADLEISLRALQHRGQESAGITIFNDKHDTHKGMGLVSSVFSEISNGFSKGNAGIGHVRYSTAGGSTIRNAQPVLLKTDLGEFSLAHNGTISNHKKIREMVNEEELTSDTDSEVVLRIISQKMLQFFHDIAATTGKITNIRALGCLVAGELENDHKPHLGQRFAQYALKHGALLRPINQTLYWLPPLNTSCEHITHLAEITLNSIYDLYRT